MERSKQKGRLTLPAAYTKFGITKIKGDLTDRVLSYIPSLKH